MDSTAYGLRLTLESIRSIPFEVHAGMTLEAERELALALNTCRRQLTVEQRREQVARLKVWGWSNPRIAEVVGVGLATVDRDLKCSGYPGGQPEQSEGRDGKAYPATKPTATDLNARQERVKDAKASGVSVREIAKAEGVSVGTVSADLARPNRPLPLSPELSDALEAELADEFESDEAAGSLEAESDLIKMAGKIALYRKCAKGTPPQPIRWDQHLV